MKRISIIFTLLLLLILPFGMGLLSCGEEEWLCQNDRDCASSRWRCSEGQCVPADKFDAGSSKEALPPEKHSSSSENPSSPENSSPTEHPSSQCTEGSQRTCYSGPTGTQGIGLCKAGTQICRQGQWSQCSGAVLPEKEICNKKDDDCDGKIDEDNVCDSHKQCSPGRKVSCYGFPAKPGVGICRAGTRTCTPQGTWGPCLGQIGPKKEICNKKDDDCDGKIDEDNVCGSHKQCSPGRKVSCYGFPAKPGVGICRAGTRTCTPQGTWGPCLGQIGPKKEICNKKDDDCDGKTDEDNVCGSHNCTPGQKISCYTFKTGKPGLGICRAGTRTCTPQGTWGPCLGQIGPKTEVCNGKDDDCDGLFDESDPRMNTRCKTNKPGICSDGYIGCYRGHLVCVPIYQPHMEICNGKDDDCDGKIDEGTPQKTFYRDADGDGYGNPHQSIKACRRPQGFVEDNTDCYDKNKLVHPHQLGFFSVHRGDGKFDYDCNGKEDKRFNLIGSCKGCKTPIFDQGFVGSIPQCGKKGAWINSCRFDVGKCYPLTRSKLQECR